MTQCIIVSSDIHDEVDVLVELFGSSGGDMKASGA